MKKFSSLVGRRLALSFLLAVPVALLLPGCGGGGGSNSPSPTPTPTPNPNLTALAGNYSGLLTVDLSGARIAASRSAARVDGGAVYFSFNSNSSGKLAGTVAALGLPVPIVISGLLQPNGNFSLNGSGKDDLGKPATISIIGKISGSAATRTLSGTTTITADGRLFNGTCSGKVFQPNDSFVGDYSGTYSGGESGRLTVKVAADGTLTAAVISPSAGTLSGKGVLDSSNGRFIGLFSFRKAGKDEASYYEGRLTKSSTGINGPGDWESTTKLSGTFTLRK